MAIRWVQPTWKDTSPSTVKRCLEKCSLRKGDNGLMKTDKAD